MAMEHTHRREDRNLKQNLPLQPRGQEERHRNQGTLSVLYTDELILTEVIPKY